MISIDIEKNFSDISLHVKLDIKEGEFVALSGKSGSGKTTLLRILSGLEDAKGEIRVGSEIWLSSKKNLSVRKRGIGFVFQDYALFENMSVEKNLLYVSKDTKLADHLLKLTELEEFKKRLPSNLSGGQKQRVALCRALMSRPKLLLMDEPLSALDMQMRQKLQNDILKLHKEFGTTTIMVSHEPSEIYRLANRMIVLEDGKIIQDATPKEILLHTKGSQKFSFEGEILDIVKADVIHIAIIAIAQQIVEVVIDEAHSKRYKKGDRVSISTKAFAPTII
jgi:molybdate transport system ATP-binding protein